MKRILVSLAAFAGAISAACAQLASPQFTTGQVPTAQTWNSLFDFVIPSGTINDAICAVDQAPQLQAWINNVGSGTGQLPDGTYGVKTTLTVSASGAHLFGHGANTVIKWCGAPGTAIAPVLDVLASADHATIHDLTFDGGANYTTPLAQNSVLVSSGSTLTVASVPSSIAAGQAIVDVTSGASVGTVASWGSGTITTVAPITATVAVNDTLSIGAKYLDSTYFGTGSYQPYGDIAVLIEADDFNGYNLWGQYGYDNCFAVGQINHTTNVPVAGEPKRFTLNNIHTKNCGNGAHAGSAHGGPGFVGGGVDNLTGSVGTIANAVDVGSFGSFINDVGNGAQAVWTNIFSFGSQIDTLTQGAHQAPAFYAGGAYSNLTNINISSPQGRGMWADFGSIGSVYNAIVIKGPGQECLSIRGGGAWSGVSCSDPSLNNPSSSSGFAGIVIDATAGSGYGFNVEMTGVSVTTAGYSTPSYGLFVNGTATPVTGSIDMSSTPVGVNAAIGGTRPSGLHWITHGSGGLCIDLSACSNPLDVAGNARVQLGSGQQVLFQDSATNSFTFFKPGSVSGQMAMGSYASGGVNPVATQWIGPLRVQPYTIASTLPACSASLDGSIVEVTDSATPTYNSVATGGGTTHARVFCDGTNWRWQ